MLTEAERFKLLGTYETPRFHYGERVDCQLRGTVVLVGMTDGPIPWPVGRTLRGRESRRGIVLYACLVDAVRLESCQGVAHWWGVTPGTVNRWRRALDVPPHTEGTRKLQGAHSSEPERLPVLHANTDAMRGRPQLPHVLRAMHDAIRGKPLGEERRRQLSERCKRLGLRPPKGELWAPEEDELVRTLRAREVAARTGRSYAACRFRRRALGVARRR